MDYYKYSKEIIKARMTKTAMSYRGVDSPEELDPLTRLFIEALTSELYILADDMTNIEVRLLDKLAKTLTPAAITTAMPAHAVAHALPLEPVVALNTESTVYYEDPALNKRHHINNLEFSPVCNVEFKKARVCRLISNGVFYSIDKKLKKTFLTRLAWFDRPSSIWVGIEIDKSIQSLKDISFYIDLPNTKNKHEYLPLLQFSNWDTDGQQIKIKCGLPHIEKDKNESLINIIEQFNTNNVINKDIYKLYESHYITIKDDIMYSLTPYPEEMGTLASEIIDKKQELTVPLLWLHIQFPPAFLPAILDDICICTNTAPVAQKILRRQSVSISELNNIIRLPIKENEAFLAIKSVTDSHDRKYKELYDKNSYTNETGTYSIRHGGCERFDTRDAHELLNRLLDLAIEERAVFTAESKNKMIDTVENMLHLINRMKESINNVEHMGESPYYLVMDCLSPKETILVEYWVTNGTIGNNLKTDSTLLVGPGLNLDSKFTCLITPTSGARSAITPQNKIRQYKKLLISHGRIVTNEDISSFCLAEYPDIITDVELRRGCAIGTKPHEGLIRTIDIHITIDFQKIETFNKEELIWILRTKLESKSPENYNYRFFIQKI